MTSINLYLICEGTSCEFINKSHPTKLHNHSSITDYGIFETHYFNNNPKNTRLFDDNNSIYLTCTQKSTIESAFFIYGNGEEKRTLFPIPYTSNSNFIRTKGDLRMLKEQLGINNNVNDYLNQSKFKSFSQELPSNNVLLNWNYESNSGSDYNKIDLKKFFELLNKIKSEKPQIEKFFLVTNPLFIAYFINNVAQNKLTNKDIIEHTSFWNFNCIINQKSIFGSNYKIKSRTKLYPLPHNHGRLQTYNDLYFYVYKEQNVPLFHYNKPFPLTYLNPKYLSLCRVFRKNNTSKLSNSSNSSNNSKNKSNRKGSSLKKILQNIKNNKMIS